MAVIFLAALHLQCVDVSLSDYIFLYNLCKKSNMTITFCPQIIFWCVWCTVCVGLLTWNVAGKCLPINLYNQSLYQSSYVSIRKEINVFPSRWTNARICNFTTNSDPPLISVMLFTSSFFPLCVSSFGKEKKSSVSSVMEREQSMLHL